MQSFDIDVLKEMIKDVSFIESMGGIKVPEEVLSLPKKTSWSQEDIRIAETYLSGKGKEVGVQSINHIKKVGSVSI